MGFTKHNLVLVGILSVVAISMYQQSTMNLDDLPGQVLAVPTPVDYTFRNAATCSMGQLSSPHSHKLDSLIFKHRAKGSKTINKSIIKDLKKSDAGKKILEVARKLLVSEDATVKFREEAE